MSDIVVIRNIRGIAIEEIKCTFVDVLGFELAVHHDLDDKKKWAITEPETGFRFCGPYDTKDAALEAARRLIKRKGAKYIDNVIKQKLGALNAVQRYTTT